MASNRKKKLQCSVCKIVVSSKASLIRHENRKHKVFSFMCNSCPFGCNRRNVMIDHWVSDHNLPAIPRETVHQKRKAPKKLLCPLCHASERNYENFWEHLRTSHETRIEKKIIMFNNKQEFENWKINIEEETISKYVCRSKSRLKGNFCTRQYLLCHRSSSKIYKSRAVKKNRSMKRLGTNKTGFACPSMMLVDWYKEKIIVTYQPTHLGHTFDILRLPLSQDVKETLAGKLMNGVPIRKIIQDVCKPATPSQGLQRIHFLKRQDLHNIARFLPIGFATKLHEDDAVSVTLLVNSLNKMENSPILDYKSESQNKSEFSLIIMTPFQREMINTLGKLKICVDGTNKLNADGIQLFTIVVVDEFSKGVPVAFYFSKKSDTAAMIKFYMKVKEELGHAIQSEVFISDDEPALYDAWVHVMGLPEKRLLSWWNISEKWTTDLNSMVQNENKRAEIKKTLLSLATKTKTISQFNNCLRNFITTLMADEDTKSFGLHFLSRYAQRAEAWAFCYRQQMSWNTNTYLESLHRRLKYAYCDGKKCYRLDKTINSLFQLTRDIIFERAIKLASVAPFVKSKKIESSHRASESTNDNDICNIESNLWSVASCSRENVKYSVEKIADKCDDFCPLYCDKCRICVHSFKCNCLDSLINFNICKHIHKVALLQLKNLSQDINSNQQISEMIIDNDIDQTENFLNYEFDDYNSNNNNDQCQLESNECYDSFLSNLRSLVLKFENISPTSVPSDKVNITKKLMEKSIKDLNSILAGLCDNEKLEPTKVVNAQKCISPQKVLPKNQINKKVEVVVSEEQNLFNVLYCNNIAVCDTPTVDIHTTQFDHDY